MSRTAHKLLAGSGGEDAYEIEQSIRLEHDDSTYLWYEPGAGGSRRTWTFSGWFKPGPQPDGYLGVFGHQAGSGASWYQNDLSFNNATNMKLDWQGNRSGSSRLITSRQFRDQSAWYHIVFAVDTTQGTASNRMKLYINGVQETGFDTETYPGSSEDLYILKNGDRINIGRIQETYFGTSYVAEVHIVDGSQLAPTSFGEVNSTTGQWVPIEYEGSHGTQGAYLKFASGAIGTDSSGNGNNWTAVNLANSDVVLDSPTNNFCVWNAVDTGSYCDLTQANLTSKGNTSADAGWTHSSMAMMDGSGKWYSEHRMDVLFGTGQNYPSVGVSSIKTGTATTTSRYYSDYCYIRPTGNVAEEGSIFTEQSSMDLGSNLSAGDIINVAVDTDNKKVWLGVNGTWNGSGNPGGGSNPTFTYSTATDLVFSAQHLKGTGSGEGTSTVTSNFGQNGTFNGAITAGGNSDGNGIGDFKYSVPSGFKAVCTKSISAPAVRPTEHFKTILYTGTGNTDYDITGVGFQPDLNWIKKRSEADNHVITDAVRGAGKVMKSESNAAEADWTDYVGPFLADGIRLNDVQQGDAVNESGQTYVMWNWKAGGGAGSSNTDGTLNTTTTSVNTAAGISIGTYTGEGGVKTVGHGLGKVPALIMVKSRSHEIDWCIYHQGAASSPEDGSLTLNDANGFDDNDNRWNDTAPTSSVFTIYSSNEVNDASKTYVYYAFAEIDGFSKFGSYEGNNNADGPFIHTGFTPAWIVFKHVDANGEWWWMLDTTRDPYGNLVTEVMYPNANSAEGGIGGGAGIDILANGFKIKGTNGGMNGYTNTFVYMAFAEFPFKYANAR